MNKDQAVVYLRVSTEEQVDNFSLETQEKLCKEEANKRGLIISQIFREEGRSAKTIGERPTLIKMLEYCRKHKTRTKAVIVYKIDRISRQTVDYLAIRKMLYQYHVTLYSASDPTDDSPSGRFIETIMASAAQYDNEVRAERSRNGMRARFMSGRFNGIPPLGYKMINKEVVIDPNTWDKVKLAWDLMATGTKSLRNMADYMNGMGLCFSLRSKKYKIRPQTAGRIFRYKFYTGILASPTYKIEIRGKHTPMITLAQFNKVQEILDARNTKAKTSMRRNVDNPDFPLRRIVRCGKCGAGLTGAWSTGRRSKFAYYRCGKPCNYKSIPRQKIHDQLTQILSLVKPKSQTRKLFQFCLDESFKKRKKLLLQRRFGINAEISRQNQLKKTIVRKNLEGIFSDDICKEQLDIVEGQLAKLKTIKDKNNYNKYVLKAFKGKLTRKINRLDKIYPTLNPTQTRALIHIVFSETLIWEYEGNLKHETRNFWDNKHFISGLSRLSM